MSSASSSIETPAFTRRTLAWLCTSLLKGISCDAQSDLLDRSHVDVLRDGQTRVFLSTSNPSRTDSLSSHSSGGPRGIRNVKDLGAGRPIGLRHHTDPREREPMIG